MDWSKPYVGPDQVSGWNAGDPCSVVPDDWQLPPHPMGYAGHRKGHGMPGDPAFIPLWLLTCLPWGNRVFFVLRPDETRESFWNYTGMTPELAAQLVAERRLIPQTYVSPADLEASPGGATLRPILEALVQQGLPLTHANAYETLLARDLGLVPEGGTWADLRRRMTDSLPLPAFTAAASAAYTEFKSQEPVAPKLEGLRGFVGERMAWQALEQASAADSGAREAAAANLRRLAEAWAGQDPVAIYWTGTLAHFGVTSRFYCRNGFSWRVEQDVRQVVGFNGSFRTAFGDTGARSEDRTVTVRLQVPRFRGTLDPVRTTADVEGLVASMKRTVWGSDADRFWHRARTLEAKARPRDAFGWHDEVAVRQAQDTWGPLIRSHARGVALRDVARLRTVQLMNNGPTLAALHEMLHGDLRQTASLEELQDLLYLVRDVSAVPKDFQALAAASVMELTGHASAASPKALMGGILDPA